MSYFNESEEFVKHNLPNYQCPFCGQKKVVMHTKNWLEAESIFKEIFQMNPPKEAHTFQMTCKNCKFSGPSYSFCPCTLVGTYFCKSNEEARDKALEEFKKLSINFKELNFKITKSAINSKLKRN